MTSSGLCASHTEIVIVALCRGAHDRTTQELSARVMFDDERAHARIFRHLQTCYGCPKKVAVWGRGCTRPSPVRGAQESANSCACCIFYMLLP